MHWLLAASPALAASPTLLAASPTLLAASPTLLRRVGGRAAPINALLAQGSRIVEVQSGARRTWSYQRPAEQVQVVLSNEGRQLDTHQRRPAGGLMVAATTQTLSAPMLVVSKATTMPMPTTCPWKLLESFRSSQAPQALANGDVRRARRRRRHQRRLNPSRHFSVAGCVVPPLPLLQIRARRPRLQLPLPPPLLPPLVAQIFLRHCPPLPCLTLPPLLPPILPRFAPSASTPSTSTPPATTRATPSAASTTSMVSASSNGWRLISRTTGAVRYVGRVQGAVDQLVPQHSKRHHDTSDARSRQAEAPWRQRLSRPCRRTDRNLCMCMHTYCTCMHPL